MLKIDELRQPDSCLNKAREFELIFVILERDDAAPHAIREWCKKRIELGKNAEGDKQITEALQWARLVELRPREPVTNIGNLYSMPD